METPPTYTATAGGEKTCVNCRWWQMTAKVQAKPQDKPFLVGDCHRHPPPVLLVPMAGPVVGLDGRRAGGLVPHSVWPPVRDTHWCGDFEPRPEAVEHGT